MKILLSSRRLSVPLAAALLVATLATVQDSSTSFATGCPAGYTRVGATSERLSTFADALGKGPAEGLCLADKHPEGGADLRALEMQQRAIQSAPDGYVPAGAMSAAVIARSKLAKRPRAAANAKSWRPVGIGPLHTMDPEYAVSQLGTGDVAGRVNDFFHVAADDDFLPNALFATTGYGGVWMTDSLTMDSWVSIGDGLPTQVLSSVAYTPYQGPTIIVVTGDDSFGGDSRRGNGVYYTTNLGRTWVQAKGVPDDAFGFKLAVDKSNPAIVYAATGAGLFRSTNGGRSFVNVKLPTGECAGKSNKVRACSLANIVTDVIVQVPGGTTGAEGGKVLAAVGWRGGNRKSPDGVVQAPANGLYASDTGAPGSFQKVSTIGFPQQDRLGRIELGPAEGPAQNHDYVYAMVQDAVLLRDGVPGIDAPEANGLLAIPTVFNGLYVSSDFGRTWKLMADASELQHPGTGSALAVVFQALGQYGPGVQAWYNMWVRPDPTRAIGGVPTRLVFGLEEVWQNENTNVPQDGHSSFKVIGRYFSGDTCLALVLPACPTNRDQTLQRTTTTHPDQHDGMFVPMPDGGVRLVVGNDGGVYSQKIASDAAEFSNANWKTGNNEGMQTLLPYDAVRSRDGTYWMGLQDNGTAKITDIRSGSRVVERQRQIMAKGGDGFFVAVHPDNGNIAYGEHVAGTIQSTIDGGRTWSAMSPPITSALFSTPFQMDPRDPNHLIIGGNEIVETVAGPGTGADNWVKVFDLGTHKKPGDPKAGDFEPLSHGVENESPVPPPVAIPRCVDPVHACPEADVKNSQTALALDGPYAYAGFCGPCDVLNQSFPFKNGIATNVGGSKPAKKASPQGWHIAKAKGLPNRYITWMAIDPRNPKTVYVALGGYYRPWTEPALFGAKNNNLGRGHLYVSTDGANSFRNVSANLPNTPINSIALRGSQILAATDVGVFISDSSVRCSDYGSPSCQRFQVLGNGLPMSPIKSIRFTTGDPNTLVAAAYGRGVWQYSFGAPRAANKPKVLPPPRHLNVTVAGPFGFETSDEGWTGGGASSAAGEWRRSGPGHQSSSAMSALYTDEASTTLTSPAITMPARSTVMLHWRERMDTESCCDFFSVEWSSDNKKWTQVRSIAGMNPGFPNFSPMTAKFVAPKGRLWVRFKMSSDTYISSPPHTGVAVDDVVIKR